MWKIKYTYIPEYVVGAIMGGTNQMQDRKGTFNICIIYSCEDYPTAWEVNGLFHQADLPETEGLNCHTRDDLTREIQFWEASVFMIYP